MMGYKVKQMEIMKMIKYTATFSTGETVIRHSNHEYRTVGAWVNAQTGKIKNVTFSKNIASPSRMGCCMIVQDNSRKYFASKQAFDKAKAASIENAKLWKLEVINL